MLGVKRRRAAVAGLAVVAAALAVWQGGRILGGPAEQEAARRAAAAFLGVEPGQLEATAPRPQDRDYRFDLRRGDEWEAIISVNRASMFVTGGLFHSRPADAGPEPSEMGAVAAARRFADEHFADLGDLGPPSSVERMQAGARSRWHVVWQMGGGEVRFSSLAVGIDAANGRVCYFTARGSRVPSAAGSVSGGGTGAQAARRAAAKLLAVQPGQLTAAPAQHPARYRFELIKHGERRATVSVSAKPILVTSGLFFGRSREAGDRNLREADAVKAARAFARKHYPDFGDLRDPAQVEASSWGRAPSWQVLWEVFRKGEPLRLLVVYLHGTTGEVISFHARKAPAAPLPAAKVARQQAIATAWAALSKRCGRTSDTLKLLGAGMQRHSSDRPLGYPVWVVKFDSVARGGDMARFAYTLDAVTGEIIHD